MSEDNQMVIDYDLARESINQLLDELDRLDSSDPAWAERQKSIIRNSLDDCFELAVKSKARDAEIHALYAPVVEALRSAKASIELFEKVLLPKAESWMIENGQYKNHPIVENAMPLKFGEPTHYANTLRQIDKALAAIKEVKG